MSESNPLQAWLNADDDRIASLAEAVGVTKLSARGWARGTSVRKMHLEAVSAATGIPVGSLPRIRLKPNRTYVRIANTPDGKRKRAKLYMIWDAMIHRCNTPGNVNYQWYGARGIKVCDEWRSYDVFRTWAISSGFRKGLTLDREDNDGDYTPGNCRWVTQKAQVYNSTRTRQITYRGETLPAPVWAKRYGMSAGTLRERLKNGWDLQRALETPLPEPRPPSSRRQLTEDQVRLIRTAKTPARVLANRFGVSVGVISQARRGDTYRNVT